MRTAEFDAGGLSARAADGWTTLTELADTLVRDHDVPFASAHRIAARVATAFDAAPDRPCRSSSPRYQRNRSASQ